MADPKTKKIDTYAEHHRLKQENVNGTHVIQFQNEQAYLGHVTKLVRAA